MKAMPRRVLGPLIAAALVTLGSLAPAAGFGVAQAISPDESQGRITDASSDAEVAAYGYRDLTMNRMTHAAARDYSAGRKTAVAATKAISSHISGGRYCAAAQMVSRALTEQGATSGAVQTFYFRTGCISAPAVTHEGPRS